MEITFLGTGTSQGVPVIACECNVCKSTSNYDKRLRSSVMISVQNKIFVIDTGPDFRQQMLRENVKQLDAVLFTHPHKDHTAGLDDIRAFNYTTKKAMEIYAEENVMAALKNEFSYAFAAHKYPGVPDINLNAITLSKFNIGDVEIIPIRAMHLKLPVLGFRIGDFAYITDANYISNEEMEKIKDVRILVINALRKEKHISHFCLQEALAIIKKTKPTTAYLTHISHLMGEHEVISKNIPENVFLAFDGLKIKL